MRREYDFSQGTRGKHVGKRINIAADTRTGNGKNAATRIQKIIERDLKSREDFKLVWRKLDQTEKENIRAAWLKKIGAVLAD